MNKTFKYALGAVLAFGTMTSAMAQDNFPDVPDNHWAYEALAKMKSEGLLVGYPDGLFRGTRPATRYELAVAVHATYAHLKGITDSLQEQIKAIGGPGIDGSQFATKTELKAVSDALAALQADVNNMKGWGDSIANLTRMAATFEKELASLGVDVEAMKKDLADLANRVGVLEKNKLPINIHGDANLLMMAGGSSSNRPGIDLTGRPVGVADVAALNWTPVGMTQDLSIFHEAALRISGNNEDGPQWHATLVAGNMLGVVNGPGGGGFQNVGGPFGSQSQTSVGLPYSEGLTNIYFQDFAVKFDTSVVGQGFSAELGRTGYSISPYIFQRPDVTPYFQNDRWDSGKWMFDGGVFGFEFGSAKFNVFGGRNSNRLANDGTEINGMSVGQVGHRYDPMSPVGRPMGLPGDRGQNNLVMGVDQSLGLHLNIPLTENGKLDLAYLFLEANDAPGGVGGGALNGGGGRFANRAQVFGGELDWSFGSIKVGAGYSQSNLLNGKNTVISRDNYAWHVDAAYEADRWGAMVGYREILPQFGAPGDWGRIGLWWNPTDIKGLDAKVHFNLTDNLKISGGGQWYTGTGRAVTAAAGTPAGTLVNGLSTDDRINRYTIDLGYRVNDSWNLNLGYEAVDWEIAQRLGAAPGTAAFAGGRPRERWYNIGLGYNLSEMAKLTFLWQVSDYNGRGVPGFSPFLTPGNGDRATGNLLTTQLSIKF